MKLTSTNKITYLKTNHLVAIFFVAFLLTRAVVLSWSDYFLTKGGRYGLLYCSPFLMAPRILGAKLKFFDKKAWFNRGSIWGRLCRSLVL